MWPWSLSVNYICAPGYFPETLSMWESSSRSDLFCLIKYDLGLSLYNMVSSCYSSSLTQNLSNKNKSCSKFSSSSWVTFSFTKSNVCSLLESDSLMLRQVNFKPQLSRNYNNRSALPLSSLILLSLCLSDSCSFGVLVSFNSAICWMYSDSSLTTISASFFSLVSFISYNGLSFSCCKSPHFLHHSSKAKLACCKSSSIFPIDTNSLTKMLSVKTQLLTSCFVLLPVALLYFETTELALHWSLPWIRNPVSLLIWNHLFGIQLFTDEGNLQKHPDQLWFCDWLWYTIAVAKGRESPQLKPLKSNQHFAVLCKKVED